MKKRVAIHGSICFYGSMSTMKSRIAIVALFLSCCCWSSGQAQLFHDDYDCNDGFELAVLDFYADANAEQNGWTLVCDDNAEKVWDISVGSLTQAEGTWLSDSSCIATTATCTFTFLDQAEDGLAGEGFLAFRYGATTLAVAEYGAAVVFSDLTACFGPACDEVPLEVADEQQEAQTTQEQEDTQANDEQEGTGQDAGVFCTDEEEEVAFDIVLDENPLDNGWSLACDNGAILWDVAPGSIADATGEWVTESACVAKTVTCTFLLTDASGDGLTVNGFYALRYGATTVAASEYGEAVVFAEEVFCFGPDCQQPALEDLDEQEDVAETDTTDSNAADGNNEGDTVGTNDTDETGTDDVRDSVKIDVAAPTTVEEHKMSTAALIGAVIGGAAGLLIVLVVGLMIWRKRSMSTVIDIYANKSDDGTDSHAGSHTDTGRNEARRGVTISRV